MRLPLELILIILVPFYSPAAAAALAPTNLLNQTAKVPALITFGDSLTDTGNNNVLATIVKSNFPPYGRDFHGHRPTGRFSNGKLAIDLLASGLGLKELLPAYMDPEVTTQDLLTGVSFGSAGSGYDDLTAQTVSVLTMNDQLEMFKEYIEKLKAAAGEERAAVILSQSLYIVCAGNNDLLITYFDTHLRKYHYDIPSYVDFLVQRASEFIQELYKLGARKIAAACVPPLGCVPAQRTLLGGDQRECAASNNEASMLFNSQLSAELKVLSSKLPDFRTVCIDLYTTVNKIIHDPSRYGLEDVDRGCCGTGTVEFAELCNEFSPYTCEDASKYAFWDGVHPTQRLYEIVVPELISTYLSLIL